jgi:RNA polymerase sigma-70 factor (ECF subfamily)
MRSVSLVFAPRTSDPPVQLPAQPERITATGSANPREAFDCVYHSYASFVWRSAHRLGVAHNQREDVMQDVFLVVHRKLPTYEERMSMRAWLSAIVIRVVRAHRRKQRRRDPMSEERDAKVDPDTLSDVAAPDPQDEAERDECVRELYAILAHMNDERREVFVLSELEELTAPEIAHALQTNVNTIYWRLRTARKEFEQILLRRGRSK